MDDPPRARAPDAAGSPRRLLVRPRGDRIGRPRLRGRGQRRGVAERRDAGRRRRARDRAPVRADVGADHGHRIAASRTRRARRDRGVRRARRRTDRARRDRAGQVRQQPQRAARAVRPAPREQHRAGLRALPQCPELGSRGPAAGWAGTRRRPARARQRAVPVPGDDDLLEQRWRGARAHARDGVGPGRAPDRGLQARRGPGGRARRLRPVRRRLHRRARSPHAVAEPLLLGGASRRRGLAGARRPRRARTRARPGVGAAARRDQRAGAAAGARRLTDRRPGHGPRPRRGDGSAPSRSSRRASRTTPSTWPRRSRSCALGTSASPTSPARSSCSAPSCRAPTGSSTSCCSRCTSRTARATPASRR